MAQTVEYYENNPIFIEGPFIACNLYEGGYRIEVEQRGHCCSVIPNWTVRKLLRDTGLPPDSREERLVKHMVNHLNYLVKEGKIVLDGVTWVAVKYRIGDG